TRAAARVLLPRAIEIGQALVDGLREHAEEGAQIELAGSVRRQADSVKDLDIVALTTRPTTLARSLAKLPEIEQVGSAGRAGARGELQAAGADPPRLPQLIELGDIRGDLHSHTIASDGLNTIAEMAAAARARDYEYLAITDHSASHGFGNAVSPDELRRH